MVLTVQRQGSEEYTVVNNSDIEYLCSLRKKKLTYYYCGIFLADKKTCCTVSELNSNLSRAPPLSSGQ